MYANLHRIFLENGAFDKFVQIVQVLDSFKDFVTYFAKKSDIMNQNEENQIEASRSMLKLINSKVLRVLGAAMTIFWKTKGTAI